MNEPADIRPISHGFGYFQGDIEVPMQVTQGGPIANHYQPNSQQHRAAQEVIVMLQYADLWRDRGTLHRNNLMRIDQQGTIPGNPVRHNIQVQVNGISGKSTVAHADVSETLMTNDPKNQQGVMNRVISALNQSLDTGHSYMVTGTSP